MCLGSLSQKCFESNTECGRCDKKGRCGIAASFEPGGRFGMAAAYRVAAPSIRIVPWAALASCWPLPQQLLPVSATGGGRRRCWPCSAERVFLFVVPKRLRAFRNYFFTGGGVAWNGICCKNLRFASCKKGLLRQCSVLLDDYVIAAQTSKLGSSFSMWMLDIKALCSGSVNVASFTYLFSTAAVRTGSAMVPAPPMQPPGQPMPSSK